MILDENAWFFSHKVLIKLVSSREKCQSYFNTHLMAQFYDNHVEPPVHLLELKNN